MAEWRAGKPAGERRGAASGRSGRPASAGAGRRRDPGEGPQARPQGRALGKGDGGGPASEQGLKPLRRLAARVVGVEGEEDAGGSPGGPRRPAPRPGCAGPRRPIPSTGLGPGRAWNRGVRSGLTARPTSQRTRPPEASGTTTIPANRSEPRSMNSPQSRSRSAEKPSDSRDSRSPLPGA